MLLPPVISFDAIDKCDLNRCLVAWGHKMGPWNRPDFGSEAFHGLRHHGELIAVTAAARIIPEQTVGFHRDDTFELGRMCAVRPNLNRVTLRLWREFVFPGMCQAHRWTWAISYQDAVLHSGDLYRFDGWVRLGRSKSGTDQRSGRVGRDKVVWGWCDDPTERNARKTEDLRMVA
jgi:antitoxin VapB